jgi:hypothetical protein
MDPDRTTGMTMTNSMSMKNMIDRTKENVMA